MNYMDISYNNYANGFGVRCVLFVSGCNHDCPGCQNPETHDENAGTKFTDKQLNDILEYLKNDYVSGITFSGGDPLYPNNIEEVTNISNIIKEKFPNKSQWLYTGFTFDAVKDKDVIKNLDVIVTERYDRNLRKIKWAGSSNQHVYKLNNGCIVEDLR